MVIYFNPFIKCQEPTDPKMKQLLETEYNLRDPPQRVLKVTLSIVVNISFRIEYQQVRTLKISIEYLVLKLQRIMEAMPFVILEELTKDFNQ